MLPIVVLLFFIFQRACISASEEYILRPDPDSENKLNKVYNGASAEYVSSLNIFRENVGQHWPLGIVPYHFDLKSYDYIIEERVRMIMDELESVSCVKFKPSILKPDNVTWIHITNPTLERSCVHEPYYKSNGEITMVLGLDCLRRQDITHALFHAIGFRDEVSHPHRDQYIRILWENIHPEYRRLFRIQPTKGKPLTEYDPMSIMHFHDRAFSVNGHATIAPLMPGLQISPQRVPSQLDKLKLRLLFGHECNKRDIGNLMNTCKNAFHKDKNQTGSTDNLGSCLQVPPSTGSETNFHNDTHLPYQLADDRSTNFSSSESSQVNEVDNGKGHRA